ncbi:MAG: hypothetical protein IH939_18480, partial [Acidobacteria bacterium]|nr:hypothetical protein [Acidobacteriota bacterium]
LVMSRSIDRNTPTVVFHALTGRLREVFALRVLATLGLPHAEEHLLAQNLASAEELLSDPQYEKLFIERLKDSDPEGLAPGMARLVTNGTTTDFQAAVDAASLVFMHSALDGVAYDLCLFSAFMRPTDWDQFVEKRQVLLSDVKEHGYEEIAKRMREKCLADFERSSLLDKVNRLFQLCRPTSPTGFDRDRLEEIDRSRHDVVHGETLAPSIADMDKAIDVLFRSGIFLLQMVCKRYDVELFAPANPAAEQPQEDDGTDET